MAELIDRVKQFVREHNVNKIIFLLENQRKFSGLFYEVFGRSPVCGGCYDSVAKEYQLLTDYANGKPLPKIYMGTIKLKKDALVWDKVSKGHYSPVSSGLTEDVLWNVLAYSPAESAQMEGLPDNWQEIARARRDELDARALVNSAEPQVKAAPATTPIEGDNVVVNDPVVEEKPVAPQNKKHFNKRK